MSSPKAAAAKPVRRPPVPSAAKRALPAAKRAHPSRAAKTADKPANGGAGSAEATRLAAEIERALANGRRDILSEEALQALMAAVCRSYSAQIEAGGSFPPLANRSRVTSTDVMVTASGLLKAANLAVFELGMWQSWTGR